MKLSNKNYSAQAWQVVGSECAKKLKLRNCLLQQAQLVRQLIYTQSSVKHRNQQIMSLSISSNEWIRWAKPAIRRKQMQSHTIVIATYCITQVEKIITRVSSWTQPFTICTLQIINFINKSNTSWTTSLHTRCHGITGCSQQLIDKLQWLLNSAMHCIQR